MIQKSGWKFLINKLNNKCPVIVIDNRLVITEDLVIILTFLACYLSMNPTILTNHGSNIYFLSKTLLMLGLTCPLGIPIL